MSGTVIQVLLSISFAVLSVLEDNIVLEFHFFPLFILFWEKFKSFHGVIVKVFFFFLPFWNLSVLEIWKPEGIEKEHLLTYESGFEGNPGILRKANSYCYRIWLQREW